MFYGSDSSEGAMGGGEKDLELPKIMKPGTETAVLAAREPDRCPRSAFSCGLGEETAQDRYHHTALALGAGGFRLFPLRNRHGLLELRIAFHTPKDVDRHTDLRVPTTCNGSWSRARRLPALHEYQVRQI